MPAITTAGPYNAKIAAAIPGLADLSESQRELIGKALEFIVGQAMIMMHQKQCQPPFEVYALVENRQINHAGGGKLDDIPATLSVMCVASGVASKTSH